MEICWWILSLDKWREEKSCFLGYVIPTFSALRLKLVSSTHLLYCRPLALLIIQSIEKRFDYIFNLEHIKSKPFILVTVSHLKFKLSGIPARYSS